MTANAIDTYAHTMFTLDDIHPNIWQNSLFIYFGHTYRVSFFFPSCLYGPKERNSHFPAHTPWDLRSTILRPPGRNETTCVTSSRRSFVHVKWFTSSSTSSMRSQIISLFALKNWSLLTNCLDGCLPHGLIFCQCHLYYWNWHYLPIYTRRHHFLVLIPWYH